MEPDRKRYRFGERCQEAIFIRYHRDAIEQSAQRTDHSARATVVAGGRLAGFNFAPKIDQRLEEYRRRANEDAGAAGPAGE